MGNLQPGTTNRHIDYSVLDSPSDTYCGVCGHPDEEHEGETDPHDSVYWTRCRVKGCKCLQFE